MQTMQKTLHQRNEQLEEDRKALEHIAQVLSQPAGTGHVRPVEREEREMRAGTLDSRAVEELVNALPSAIALVGSGELLHGNAAFANAFGYRSFEELREAGGMNALVPGGLDEPEAGNGAAGNGAVQFEADARTSGRRLIHVTFEKVPLQPEPPLDLLKLVDQTAKDSSKSSAELAAMPEPAALETVTESAIPEQNPPTAPVEDLPAPEPEISSPGETSEPEEASDPEDASAPEEISEPEEMPAAVEPATAETPPETLPADETLATAIAERQFNFLAKVSHEVRTPLNSILGFTELMIGEKLGAIENARYKGYIEDIHQSGLYALSLLNDLLDLSKIEAGEFELDFTAVEIGEIVDECLHILQPMARRERILVRVSLEPDLPCVIADPRRLKQILLNLLSNAIKFTREGGQVILSGSRTPDGGVRLRIRDNGVGMTADEIQLAMQPFHQLDTTPRKQTGTGLGLPLTKALVEANRARFLLTSETEIGTSADVIFPHDRVAEERR